MAIFGSADVGVGCVVGDGGGAEVGRGSVWQWADLLWVAQSDGLVLQWDWLVLLSRLVWELCQYTWTGL